MHKRRDPSFNARHGRRLDVKPSKPAKASSGPMDKGERHNGGWPSFIVCILLAAVVWAVFGQTLHFGFVNYDDGVYVYENPTVAQGLSWHGIVRAFTHHEVCEWLPLTDLSRMLDCSLYGLQASGHHLTNVLLHAATAILLFLILRKMIRAFWSPAFVAAVFAIHPLRVESVAWVTERKDVLSGLFFMLTLWMYARHAQKESKVAGQGLKAQPGSVPVLRFWTWDYYLALFFFALGLLSKTTLVTVPFVLLLLDYWPLNRLPAPDSGASRPPLRVWRDLFLEKVPFLLLTAAACMTTMWAHKDEIVSGQIIGFSTRIENAVVSYVTYLWQMVYPAGLVVFYPYPRNHLAIWKVGLSLLVLGIISAGVLAGRRKHPYLSVGWFWYMGMLVPVIGIMQAGEQAQADRHTYLPQIGLYILVTWGMAEVSRSWRHRRAVLGVAAAVILTGLLGAAYVQTTYWKNSVSLWTHALACGENYLAHNGLGNALAEQGKLDEAIQHFETALRLGPTYAEAHGNWGIVLGMQGNPEAAIQQFEMALRLKPDSPEIQNNWGYALLNQGKLDEAIQHFETALHLKPDFITARVNLGRALVKQEKLDIGIQQLNQALNLAAAQGDMALAEAIRAEIKSCQKPSLQPQSP